MAEVAELTTHLIHGPHPDVLYREPTPGRWYFGIHADGQTGALAQWTGFSFESSESDDVDMTIYDHLQEQPLRE